MNYVTLNNGIQMPMVGYGVFEIPTKQTARCVFDALETGYRLIDTAQAYYNEKEVGDGIQRGIRELGIRREDIFLTTKVWVTEFGYEKTKASVEESFRKLQTDYLDLVLIHQCLSDYYGAYRALEDLYNEGKIRAIGISNFSAERMADIATFNRIIPAVNQVETHLFWQQYDLHEWMEKYNIRHEAWGPLAQHRLKEVLEIPIPPQYFKLLYCSSETGSHHSLLHSSPGTSTAMCENQLSFFAPCQCLTFAGIITTLPSCRLTASFPSS